MTFPAIAKNRIQSIDVLRGIVMIIMALDHVRDYFHNDAFQNDPLNPQTSYPALYFTRWITHFCAPTFVLLAGTSAYLVGLRKTKAELSSFLIKRGLWLILVEIVLITLALSFNPAYSVIFLQVIWATGISLVMLGLLVRLPYKAIFTIGALIVVGHNLLDFAEAGRTNEGFWWDLLHSARFSIYPYAPGHSIAIAYPFLPWVGILLMGYCLGKLFEPKVDRATRKKWLNRLGIGLMASFILLRFINIYGDPAPWSTQKNALATFFSFMNVTKYPPSLLYTCATLGPALLLLSVLESVQNRVTAFANVFGRVPFFYYVLHFYLVHLLSAIAFFLSGYGVKDIISPQVPFFFRPAQFGFSLWVVYLVWIGIIALLYPLCKRYNRYKSTHHQWWLSYV